MDVERYRGAKELLITSDGGGNNGSRSRLWWKVTLQELANCQLQMSIHVCHFSLGTSKWNTIEHRMFSHISQNWRGRSLIRHEVIVQLITNTTTAIGLKIQAELAQSSYPTGLNVSDEKLTTLNLKKIKFHRDWNYCLFPQ
jgi:hypothetical protein